MADPRFLSVLSNSLKQQLSRTFAPRTTVASAEQLRASLDAHVAGLRSPHEAGARLLIGTDASRTNPAAHGISVHREMELFSKPTAWDVPRVVEVQLGVAHAINFAHPIPPAPRVW